ncbi:MAG: YidH family protein [Rhizobiaceae bacterium]
MSEKRSTSTNTELAKERNREAAERTLMAWIRTSISMIGFGIGFGAAGEYLGGSPSAPTRIHDLQAIGSAFIVLAVISMFAAVVQNVRLLKRIKRDDFTYIEPVPIGLITSCLILLFGLLGFIWINFR